jgi:hypothetical protein
MDLLLEPASELAGEDLRRSGATRFWPAYNDLWLRLAATLAEYRPVLLFAPLLPDDVEQASSHRMFAAIEWAVLDCADDTCRERLVARAYDTATIDAAVDDARRARSLKLFTISSEDASPDETAAEIVNWASRDHGDLQAQEP